MLCKLFIYKYKIILFLNLLITVVFKWKVRLHITLKHSEIAADVNVEVLEPGSNLIMFLHKYFPDTPGTHHTQCCPALRYA